MNPEFKKRLFAGLWVVGASTLAFLLTSLTQFLGALDLTGSPQWYGLAVIILTAVISQVTKYLNNTYGTKK